MKYYVHDKFAECDNSVDVQESILSKVLWGKGT